jgi:hypothetical protein
MARKGNGLSGALDASTALANSSSNTGQSTSGAPGARVSGGMQGVPERTRVVTPQAQVAAVAELLRGGKADAGESADDKGGDDADKRAREDAGDDAQDSAAARARRAAAGDEDPDQAGAGGEGGDKAAAAGALEGESAGEGERVTVRDLADHLGVKAAELYEDLQVPVGKDADGAVQYVTLSEARAAVQKLREVEGTRQKWDDDKTTTELAFMQARRELGTVLDLIGPAISPEVAAIVQRQDQRTLERERGLLLTALPEWKDPARLMADRDIMAAHLAPYGFSRLEVEALRDHRIARYVHDQAKRERRAKEIAEAARKKPLPQNQAPTGTRAHPGARPSLQTRLAGIVKQGQSAKTREGKASAVAALLRETGKG